MGNYFVSNETPSVPAEPNDTNAENRESLNQRQPDNAPSTEQNSVGEFNSNLLNNSIPINPYTFEGKNQHFERGFYLS